MRRVYDPEARQAVIDEQEADLRILTDRQQKDAQGVAAGESVTKDVWQDPATAKAIPLPPRPWFRNIAYTRAGLVAVPRKPYHQQVTCIGMNNVAYQLCYSNDFPLSDTLTCPGDRNTAIMVAAGQDVWMRSEVVDGTLGVIVQPYLGSLGQTLTTEGNGFMHEIPVAIEPRTRK